MRKEKTQYQAKVINDAGLTRARVPSPLLRTLGAIAGDHVIFCLGDSGKATLHVSRSRKKSSKRPKRR